MATTITRYLDTASTGGDGTTDATSGASAAYATMSAALADIKVDYPDFVSSDVVVRLKCRASTSAADTTSVSSTTATTDATRYLVIEPYDSSQAADPSGYKTDRYRLEVTASGTGGFNFSWNYYLIKGIQFKVTYTGTSSARYGLYVTPGGGTGVKACWADCRFHFETSSTSGDDHALFHARGTADDMYIVNSIFTINESGPNSSTNGPHAFQAVSTSGIKHLYNCLFYGGFRGVNMAADGDIKAINCIGYNTSDSDFDAGTYATGTVNNLSEDTTAPGTSAQQEAAVTWESAGTDFRLAGGDTGARDLGATVSGITLMDSYSFGPDMLGTSRPQGSAWDIGPHEAAAVGGGGGEVGVFTFQSLGRGVGVHANARLGGVLDY